MPVPRKTIATVTAIHDLDQGVYLLTLQVPRAFTRFKAGQFTHLTIDAYNPQDGFWPESRVFSLASEPGGEEIRIVYSVKGRYTSKMRDTLKVGEQCWLKLPYGSFIIDDAAEGSRPLILVAGGTGIAPYIPYLMQRAKGSSARETHLFYGIRDPSLLVFEEELNNVTQLTPDLSIHLYSELTAGDDRFRPGRIRMEDILAAAAARSNPIYYLSGPPAMIGLFKERLLEAEVPRDDIRIDEWE